ncbi:hypothetical protein L249_1799 [Ophiocordyceps polyrhachis-furcata BCC 54312]|uniref:tyrosinase n=1 Tax=Ophiocordyceps polyrhachis-furcata BCC 54312 TaxID=1330021 RepID=A0A367LQA1_9HYPO|nr:hypothetical protein L249_1799 [Ophiocordyceps polyrhachis-furcata BCC 54312]
MSLRKAALLVTVASTSLVSADPYPITGVKVEKGSSLPIRRNVDELASEKGPQWDLYIQSLSSMYEMNPDDALSFFQIAGIHGWPYVEWNGTGKGIENSGWPGYCPHGEPIFLPWHRAYVLLFEQSLVETAKQIASQYPEKERNTYVEAANSLRSPYWDWATSNKVPDASLPAKLQVKTAKGQKEVTNPLASYKYPEAAVQGRYGDLGSAEDSPSARGQIQRCPSPRSYPQSANEEMDLQNNNRRRQDYGDMVYDAFTTSQTFARFASTGSQGISLEQIHNFIHIEATCASDFLNSRVSGFDPLFMLHHSNIDRLWAYWQAIHPKEAIFSESYRGGPRFTTPQGSTIGPDSPLAPFFGPGGKPHTSKTVLSIQQFGYSYEGLEYGAKSDKEIEKSAMRMISKLYGKGKAIPDDDPSDNEVPDKDEPSDKNEIPDGRPPKKERPDKNTPPSKNKPPFGNGPFSNGTRPDLGRPPKTGPQPGNGTTQPDKEVEADLTNRRYAQVKINVEEVEKPCFVSIFVANVYAGSMVVMPQPSTGIVNGAIFLNTAIEQLGNNGSSSSFENSIGCEITKTDGTVIELKSVPSLKIEIDQVILTPPKAEDELSVPTERKAEQISSFSPPPPGSAGSAGGPPLPPVERDPPGGQDDQGGQPEYGDGGKEGGKGGKGDGKTKPKTVTSSAVAKVSPLPVLLLASVLFLT